MSGAFGGRWRVLTAALLAILGGLLWSLCFGRQEVPWLPWVGLAPLFLLAGGRRPFLLGWLYGTAFWLGAVPWIVHTLKTFGGLSAPLAVVLLFLMALYLGLYSALFVRLAAPVWRRGGGWALLGLPALWVAVEWLRAHLFGGFPWNLTAYAWVEVGGALPLAAWVGAYGVSWLVAWVGVGLALGWRYRCWQLAVLAGLVPLVLLSVAGRWSGRLDGEPNRPALEVRIIQPNSPLGSSDPAVYWRQYRHLIELSEQACDASKPLLLWPESAAWPHRLTLSAVLRDDLERLGERGCGVILSSVSLGAGGELYNSAFLVATDGSTSRYDKRQLVPFGEFVPFAEVLPFVDTLAREAGHFTAGRNAGLLPWRGEQIAMAICYEVIFPQAVAEQVRAGATLLATVTNDGWYGDTAAPWQHFRAARFRAAETRRPMLRAALTGVSGLIDAQGAVQQLLRVGEEGVLAARVFGASGLTPYVRWPWLVPSLAVLLGLVSLAAARR